MRTLLARMRRVALVELLLIVGLPLAVMIAGAHMTVTAINDGFTPIAHSAVAPKGH